MKKEDKKLFAAASLGGHWKQLLRITTPLEERFEVVYASTHPRCASMVGDHVFYLMADFSRTDAWRFIPSFFRLLRLLRHERPDAVLTTGAGLERPFSFTGAGLIISCSRYASASATQCLHIPE